MIKPLSPTRWSIVSQAPTGAREYADGYIRLKPCPGGYLLTALHGTPLAVGGHPYSSYLVLFFGVSGQEVLRPTGIRVYADRVLALVKFGSRNPDYILLEKNT